jgi:ribosome-associated protein
LIGLAGKRITEEGILIIEARQFRTQKQNRQDAMNRLIELIHKATEIPKRRGKTKPTSASRKRRLDTKRHRSEAKHKRRSVSNFEG